MFRREKVLVWSALLRHWMKLWQCLDSVLTPLCLYSDMEEMINGHRTYPFYECVMSHLQFLSLLALCTQWSDLLLLWFLSVHYSLGEFLCREFYNIPVALLDLVKTDSSWYLWVESVPDYPMRMNVISRATCDWFGYEHVTSNGPIKICPRMFSPEPAGETVNVFLWNVRGLCYLHREKQYLKMENGRSRQQWETEERERSARGFVAASASASGSGAPLWKHRSSETVKALLKSLTQFRLKWT